MKSYADTANKLTDSILRNDRLILYFAIANLVLLVFLLGWAVSRLRNEKVKLSDDDKKKIRRQGQICGILYNIFITIITMFPLLGMFGTVSGLLGLDLANGDMENIKNNFFIALTSTAWGIIFSIIYKLLNAIFGEFIENKINVAKKVMPD